MNVKHLFILFIPIIIGCNKNENCGEGTHNAIKIENNSLMDINWRLFISDSIYQINGEPYDQVLTSASKFDYNIRGETCWEEYFNTLYAGYEYFLIFDNDTVKAIGWQAISGTERGLLKRVKVDLNYLQANNFTITYP